MKVLVATKERSVFDVLGSIANAETIAALDTRRIYDAIPETQLAIVDYEDLIPQPFSVDLVRKLLGEAPLQQCSSSEFLAAPNTYIGAPAPSRHSFALPDKRTIAFTSYSGGTGKTSLALDTALHFVSQTKKHLQLPAALFEFSYGGSALAALVGEARPTLDELISQPEAEPFQFQGVSLYPMEYDRVRDLSIDQVAQYCRQQIGRHVLTVIDAIWPHGMVSAIGQLVDLWVVLATPRLDAVENAKRLQDELASEYGSDRAVIAVNKMGGLGATLSLMGMRRNLEIPSLRQTEVLFGGRLGKPVLTYVYNSLWREYEGRRMPRLRRQRRR